MEKKKPCMANQIYIKQATKEDIPNIHSVIYNVWPQTYAPIISQDQIDFMLDMMYSESSLIHQIEIEKCVFLIASLEGKPVGISSISCVEPEKFKLNKLYVDLAFQGYGIGKLLLHESIQRAITAKAKAMTLNVNRFNKAKAFYESQGFEIIDEVDVSIGNGFYMNDFIMEKKLIG